MTLVNLAIMSMQHSSAECSSNYGDDCEIQPVASSLFSYVLIHTPYSVMTGMRMLQIGACNADL